MPERKYTVDGDGNRRCGTCGGVIKWHKNCQRKNGSWSCLACCAANSRRHRERLTGKPCLPRPRREKAYHLSEDGTMAYIPLTQGMETIIDVADLPIAMRYRWCVRQGRGGKPYAGTRTAGRVIKLHALLCGGIEVDHISRDT